VWRDNANRRIPVSHKYHPGDWTWVPHDRKQMGGPLDQGTMYECSEIAGSPQGFPPAANYVWLWSRKKELQRACNRDKRALWDQAGLSHFRYEGLVMVRDEARLRRGHNDQSCRGHQCSETTLTGECWFHISTPLGIEPGSLMMGSKRVDHRTSGTAGSPQGESLPNWRYCPANAKRGLY
jgi:hypothetical protein